MVARAENLEVHENSISVGDRPIAKVLRFPSHLPLEHVLTSRPKVTMGPLPDAIVSQLGRKSSPFYEVYKFEMQTSRKIDELLRKRALEADESSQLPLAETVYDDAAGD